MDRKNQALAYSRESKPFGRSWEEWAARWCTWLLSISKDINPSLDSDGRNCAINQNDPNVWFLTGTFGNITQVTRRCVIPDTKAIFLPIIEKEDSFAEDTDLTAESDLAKRANEFIDRVKYTEFQLDGLQFNKNDMHRVQSIPFNLRFPVNGVYDVKPGLTRAVCDGYWIFLKPLTRGYHTIKFAGEVEMIANDVVTQQFLDDPLYNHIKEEIHKNASFRLDIVYNIIVQ